MTQNIQKQRIFTVLAYSDDPDRECELEYQTVLALDEDEAIEYCGGVENVLDIFEGTFEHPADLDEDEDELDYERAGASLYTVVHYEDGELMYTDVIANSSAEATSWFAPGDVFDVWEARLAYMVG